MRTVVVTGASRGLGREFVRGFRARGDRVIAACRQPTEEVAAEGAEPMVLDVASPASVEAFAQSLDVPHIDLLLHNAGIPNGGFWAASEGLGALELEAMERVLRTNCLGPLLLTQALLPRIETAERPIVAGVSSLFSSLTRRKAFADNFAYSMSKVSLNMWLRSLHFLRPGVRTVALDPGWARTDMGGPDAPLDPKDVVAGCLRVLGDLTDAQSGGYLSWEGKPVPW